MSEKTNPWKIGQVGSNNPLPISSDLQKQLDDLNRQYQNRSCWRKLKDWWLYPKGHRQIAMDESHLTIDQYLLLKIHQQQIHETARTHQLFMVTLLLVIIGFVTLAVMIIK
jgi:hypothetical protein